MHDKSLYVSMNEKLSLIKDGHDVELSYYDGQKLLWEVAENHVVEETKQNV